jgi:hypothetical protein
MKTATIRMICRMLIVSLFMLPFQSVWAGMVGTDQAISAATAQAERSTVMSVINRADVASQLRTMGLDTQTAQARVAAMSDDEVRTLSGRLDALPAGASSSNGWAWAAVIIIAVIIYYAWK